MVCGLWCGHCCVVLLPPRVSLRGKGREKSEEHEDSRGECVWSVGGGHELSGG